MIFDLIREDDKLTITISCEIDSGNMVGFLEIITFE